MRMALEVAMLIAALLLGGVAIYHWRRAGEPVLRRLGLAWTRRGPTDFLTGFLIAGATMVLIYLTATSIAGLRSSPADGQSLPIASFAVMCFGALKEEILWRSFLLSGLIVLLHGRWKIALALSSLVFGLIHFGNPSASWLSVLGNALGGLMYGLAFVRTGTLWFPVGLHLGWNFVQGPILGFPVSGYSEGGLLQIVVSGSPLLIGGSYGPEAGLIGIAARFVVIGAILAWTRDVNSAGGARPVAKSAPGCGAKNS